MHFALKVPSLEEKYRCMALDDLILGALTKLEALNRLLGRVKVLMKKLFIRRELLILWVNVRTITA